jgi:hypothetical protein
MMCPQPKLMIRQQWLLHVVVHAVVEVDHCLFRLFHLRMVAVINERVQRQAQAELLILVQWVVVVSVHLV